MSLLLVTFSCVIHYVKRSLNSEICCQLGEPTLNYKIRTPLAIITVTAAASVLAASDPVPDSVISDQRAELATATQGKGYGPQAPRDIDDISGNNTRLFAAAPEFAEMNLCNIHLHDGAEHRGGEFTTYLGNGDGSGHGTGFGYNGELSAAELEPYSGVVGAASHGQLQPGDTIEVHYVYTTAQVSPGPTLGACLSDAIQNPQLRVEAQVVVVVNDPAALDFIELADVQKIDGVYQAINLPDDTGSPVEYAGSTTGPDYNVKGSPLLVSWSVRPEVAKVDIASLAEWFAKNQFEEASTQGTRNLVINPDLLSRELL